MSWETFVNCVNSTERFGEIVLGGGEPTIHPQFWRMLQFARGRQRKVFIITNGSRTEIARKLLEMSVNGHIRAFVSSDRFHDEIDVDLKNAFVKHNAYVTAPTLIKAGRAEHLSAAEERCCCPSITFVQPSGLVYFCGCQDLCLGSVNTNYFIPPNRLHCSSNMSPTELEDVKRQALKTSSERHTVHWTNHLSGC